MNKFIEKFFAIQSSISKEKGTIRLLALLELNEFQGKWEMVLSAEWLPESTRSKTLDLIIDKMSAVLDSKEYYQVTNITLLRTHEPFVQAFEQLLEENPHQREFTDIEINYVEIKRAYVIAPQIYTFEELWLQELQAKTRQLETEVRSLLEVRNQWREILKLSTPNNVYDLSPSEWNTTISELPRSSMPTETRLLSMSDKPSNQIVEKINKQ
jgi:hypothetical protein